MPVNVGTGAAPPPALNTLGGFGTSQTGVLAGASTTIAGPATQMGSGRVYGGIGSTQAFTAYLLINDGAGNWVIYKKMASAAGDDATYGNVVELDQYCPSLVRIDVKNTSGSTSSFVYDVKFFNTHQS